MFDLFLVFISAFLWFGYWGAESGASFPWSSKWQKSFGLNLRQLPEVIFALSIGAAWVCFRNLDDSLPLWINVHDFLITSIVAYGGKQAATWGLLSDVILKGYKKDDNGDGVVNYKDGRNSKIKVLVDDIAQGRRGKDYKPKIWCCLGVCKRGFNDASYWLRLIWRRIPRARALGSNQGIV